MNSREAEQLLEKYWKCETSLEEENALRQYFAGEDLPDHLQKFSKMFIFFDKERKSVLDESFDPKILDRINKVKNRNIVPLPSTWYKVAAAVLLIISLVVINRQFIGVRQKATEVVQDTFADPEKALEETKKMLLLVSEKLNKANPGMKKMAEFNKAEKVLKNDKLKEI